MHKDTQSEIDETEDHEIVGYEPVKPTSSEDNKFKTSNTAINKNKVLDRNASDNDMFVQTPHSLDLQAKGNSKPEAITKKTLPKLQNSFKCDMCSLRFRLHDTLVMHLIHVHDVDERKAKCFGTS